jgi:hypothetical protein
MSAQLESNDQKYCRNAARKICYKSACAKIAPRIRSKVEIGLQQFESRIAGLSTDMPVLELMEP